MEASFRKSLIECAARGLRPFWIMARHGRVCSSMACATCPRVVADHRATSTDDPHSTRSRQDVQQLASQARQDKLRARASPSRLRSFAQELPHRMETKPFMLDARNNAFLFKRVWPHTPPCDRLSCGNSLGWTYQKLFGTLSCGLAFGASSWT